MGKVFEEVTPEISKWIQQQHLFFVANAPLSSGGHVSCSPKGLDSLRLLGPKTVAYIDLTGSGAEISRVSDSCGYGIPKYDFAEERDTLLGWAEIKGENGLDEYRAQKNMRSIDGLPCLSPG